MKDCKNTRCYNETNNTNGYCHDCVNRQREDASARMASCEHVYLTRTDTRVRKCRYCGYILKA